MTVAVQSCTDDVKQELVSMGYDIVDFNSYTGYADAIIYTGHISNTFSENITGSDNGIFVINAEGKTAYEIDNILQKRLYSPIFFL